MTKKVTSEDLYRLEEIKDEIKSLIQEAEEILRGTSEEDRAHSYWAAHIKMALDKDHSYLGGSMCTLQDSIESLREEDTPEEEPEEEPKGRPPNTRCL